MKDGLFKFIELQETELERIIAYGFRLSVSQKCGERSGECTELHLADEESENSVID